MARTQDASSRIEVVPALPEQSSVLANLLELYAHDFSEFHNIELQSDGRFGYQDLPLYWSDPGRHPFLVKVEGNLAGLVLVKQGPAVSGSGTVWDMAEFFVTRGYRRQGIGTRAAHEVWRRFPGRWEVRVMEANGEAHDFWQRAIAAFQGETVPPVSFEKDAQLWRLFSFESDPRT